MKKVIAAAIATTALAITPAAAFAAPGSDIQEACGAPFGALIAGGKSSGAAAHSNYRGGANAFSDPAILAAHGCGAG